MSFYQECEPSLWQGRKEGHEQQRVFQAVQTQSLRKPDPKPANKNTVGLLGFACDEGVARNLGRRGASQGPDAIRASLAPLCLDQARNINLVDFGNVGCPGENLESAQAELGEKVAMLHTKGVKPIILGGGHETAWGHFLGLSELLKGKRWGIVNFDAHFDLRPNLSGNKGSSGTPFQQIAQFCSETRTPFNYLCISIQKHANSPQLFKTAESLGVRYILADEIHLGQWDKLLATINSFYQNLDYLYLSICLDAFATQVCPGVSAPQARGIHYNQFLPLFKEVLESKKVCSADIVELAPLYDLDNRTAKFAASIVLDIIQANKFASLI